ncbi:hypothetical protein FACS189450_11670 [Spirochaetia bacterium]|nr:hypothetical protein FACS189450_11670 [Spirochaetia bacterium]
MKRTIRLLAAALGTALLAALLFACANPLMSPGGSGNSIPDSIPEGKGIVRIDTGTGAARTAMPATVFDHYEYWFSQDGGDTVEQKSPGAGGKFELDAGTGWTVTVKAFAGAEDDTLAAEGTSAAFNISAGVDAGTIPVTLHAVVGEGAGSFTYSLTYPATAAVESFTLTLLADDSPIDLFYWGIPSPTGTDPLTLSSTEADIPAGYYLARAVLKKGSVTRGKTEVVHIYNTLDTPLTWTFNDDNFAAPVVTSSADSGPGTLRDIIDGLVTAGETIFISLPEGNRVIRLDSPLYIYYDLTLQGNGVTLTPSASYDDSDVLLTVGSSGTVNISRVHFKNVQLPGFYGSAIYNAYTTVNLESCIFSGNRADSGGAIFNNGTLTVKGSTFYGNSALEGGAILDWGTLTLTGNVFYGNTAAYYPVVAPYGNTVTSDGYNVVDLAYGTNDNQSGWTKHTDDKVPISILPVSAVSFRLLSGSGAANVINPLPGDYPEADFYGNAITAPAAAGAVQGNVSGTGYVLALSVNNSALGSVTASPEPNEDGLVNGTVTLTATPTGAGNQFVYWLVDGVKSGSSSSRSLTVTDHTTVQAVFGHVVTVTSLNNSGTGTLRNALDNAQDGDIIRFNAGLVTPGTSVIELDNYGLEVTENITIEGNGVTLKPGASWSGSSSILYVFNSVTVNISRVHFKDGRATNSGAAVYFESGTLNLESCIFSGNEETNFSGGGAIYNDYGDLTVKGSTFYGNSTSGNGGAIMNFGTLTLTGNVFYGNTADYDYPVVADYGNPVTSGGYNVVDLDYGTNTNQSGWAQHGNDKTPINTLPISPVSFKTLGSGAANVITTLPAEYPTTDFYGNAISNGAAAGAVQGSVSGGGYVLALSVNSSALGSVAATQTPNADGLVSGGSVTLTATPTGSSSVFVYWLVNGANVGSANPKTLNVTAHTTVQAVFAHGITVTSLSNSGTGTLRAALANAENGDTILLPAGGSVIELDTSLEIDKDLTIEGNGVTLTPSASWDGSGVLLIVGSYGVTAKISRVHFKDGRSTGDGGAIYKGYLSTLNLESCIFSGNQAQGSGAIYNFYGDLTVKGSTFYGNSVTGNDGGAIYNVNGTVTLTGNVFYGNTTVGDFPVVGAYGSGSVTSGGYNVADAVIGTSIGESGWTAAPGDAPISGLPISPVSFRPLTGSGAANVLTTLPAGYPVVDFYGNAITDGAAAGAVQGTASGSGFVLALSVNKSALGSVTASPTPNADGLVSGNVILTPVPNGADSEFAYWLVDGVNDGDTANPRTFNVTAHTTVQAVFSPVVIITSLNDSGTGTLRDAVDNAQNGDIIRFNAGLVTPGTSVIALDSMLEVTKNITIEGNGVTLTPSGAWSVNDSLLGAYDPVGPGITVNISRVHFKDGRTTNAGAAILNDYGTTLNLESCIFSGNVGSGASGGAIATFGYLTVKGCTFYENSADYGGAIYNDAGGTLTLTGNLFYGNTDTTSGDYPVVWANSGVVSSGGYNVADVVIGTYNGESGWTAVTGDTTLTDLGISGDPVNDDGDDGFEPTDANLNIVPSGLSDFPTKDFYGNLRTFPGAAGAVK